MPTARSVSAELARARDLLRDLLLREDATEDILLVEDVREGLNRIIVALDELAGLQQMWELWDEGR